MLVKKKQINTKEGGGRPQLKTITRTGLMIVLRCVRDTPSPILPISCDTQTTRKINKMEKENPFPPHHSTRPPPSVFRPASAQQIYI